MSLEFLFQSNLINIKYLINNNIKFSDKNHSIKFNASQKSFSK